MFHPKILVAGMSLALVASLPAQAWQHRGGSGRSTGTTTGQRGTMMQDRDTMRDRDMMRDRDRDTMRDQDRDQDRDRDRDRDRLDDGSPIYGSQLMTATERNAYRAKMRSLKTAREREELRAQHHQEMQQRARERGVTLPETPPGGSGRMSGTRERTEQQTEQRQRTEQQEEQREREGGGRR